MSTWRRAVSAARWWGSVWRRFSVRRDRWDAVGDGGEGAAGVDLGELAGVADQDELGPCVVGGVDEAGEVAGADHGGFVDDEHGAVVEEGPTGVEDADDAVDGLGRDAGAGLEFGRGSSRERGAEDRVAVVVVGVAEPVERGGLARAGLADHQRDRVTRPGHPFDQAPLLAGQSRPGLNRRADRRVAGDADAGARPWVAMSTAWASRARISGVVYTPGIRSIA